MKTIEEQLMSNRLSRQERLYLCRVMNVSTIPGCGAPRKELYYRFSRYLKTHRQDDIKFHVYTSSIRSKLFLGGKW